MTLISTVIGKRAIEGDYNAEYWAHRCGIPCSFTRRSNAHFLAEHGVSWNGLLYAVLSPLISECAPPGTAVIGSLRRNRDERASLVAAIGQLYSRGQVIDFRSVFGESRTIVALPAYPYQRTRLWVPEVPRQPARPAADPLIGEPLKSPRFGERCGSRPSPQNIR